MAVTRVTAKPEQGEAVLWDRTTETRDLLREWAKTAPNMDRVHPATWNNTDGCIALNTTRGTMYALPGDWIVRGQLGYMWVCPPPLFKDAYERTDAQHVKCLHWHKGCDRPAEDELTEPCFARAAGACPIDHAKEKAKQ